MLQLTAKITIRSAQTWEFDRVSEVEIVRDSETLTDTCRIVLPRKVKWNGSDDIPLRRGDAITVELGYNGNNQFAFAGYVTSIGLKSPIEIRCEDEMWRMKSIATTKKAYKAANLKTLISDQQVGIPVNVFGEQNIGDYRVTADTVAELLNELRKQGIRSFIRYKNAQPELCIGVLFDRQGEHRQVFDNQRNIISDSLQWQTADDVKLKVKAVNLDKNNKQTVVEVGDADGEVRTLYATGKSDSQLRSWAEQELKRLKRDGLVGSFDTFGHLLVDKLDSVAIVIDSVRRGEYQVQNNTIKYGSSGFRQSITLGDRLA